jgi:hypothetical protein
MFKIKFIYVFEQITALKRNKYIAVWDIDMNFDLDYHILEVVGCLSARWIYIVYGCPAYFEVSSSSALTDKAFQFGIDFWNYKSDRQFVGLLGKGIGPSWDLCANTPRRRHRINADIHHSWIRNHDRRQYASQTALTLWTFGRFLAIELHYLFKKQPGSHRRAVYLGIWGYPVRRSPLWSTGQSSWLQIQRSRVRFPALPDFLRSSGSGTGST